MAREVWSQGPFERGGFRIPPIGRPPAATVRGIVFGLLGLLLLLTSYYQVDPVFMLVPGIAIFITVLAFNLFGDGLRDALDPRAR